MRDSLLMALSAISTIAIGTSDANSQITLVMANEYSSTTTLAVGDQYFADRVSEISDGSLEIDLHLDGELGYRSADNLEAVQNGSIDIASTLSGTLGHEDAVFLVSLLPFIVDGADQANVLYEAALPFYQDFFEYHDQVLLYASPWPASGLWSNRPIVNAEDLAGLRLRTYDPLGTETFQGAGADPIQISWADVMPHLESGEIEAAITSAPSGYGRGFGEYLSYFSEINYASSLQFVHINSHVFESLSDEHQAVLLQAAEETIEYNRLHTAERLGEIYVAMEEGGVEVLREIPEEIRWQLVTAAAPIVSNWMNEAGDRGRSILAEFSDAIAR